MLLSNLKIRMAVTLQYAPGAKLAPKQSSEEISTIFHDCSTEMSVIQPSGMVRIDPKKVLLSVEGIGMGRTAKKVDLSLDGKSRQVPFSES